MSWLKITNTETGEVEYDTSDSCNIRVGHTMDSEGTAGPWTHETIQLSDEKQLDYYRVLKAWFEQQQKDKYGL